MQPTSHFETLAERSVSIQSRIKTFIHDLHRLVRLLEADIETEEDRTDNFDYTSANYSDLARRLRLRRDNLIATIALLEDE